jgi:alkanesulfonate monooxygenase SsuD/methylene tetrahydromethanopterin reductase-like flavin-dependent oxidoreductase (luciferase family)
MIPEAGLNPLPVQRPIPIWIGASADAALERVGRLGDGWFPQMPPNDKARESIEKLREYTVQAGRKPEDVGIEARLSLKGLSEDAWHEQLEGWRKLGATHVSVNTMGMGLSGVGAHIDTLRRFREVVS